MRLLSPKLVRYLFDSHSKHTRVLLIEIKESKGIEANLIAEARKCTRLMIWTDCDREGENIGAEVASVCRRGNGAIVVTRARFSVIMPA